MFLLQMSTNAVSANTIASTIKSFNIINPWLLLIFGLILMIIAPKIFRGALIVAGMVLVAVACVLIFNLV